MKKIAAIPRRANETANLKVVGLPVLIATVNHNRRQHTKIAPWELLKPVTIGV
jgi:hypothetical protein